MGLRWAVRGVKTEILDFRFRGNDSGAIAGLRLEIQRTKVESPVMSGKRGFSEFLGKSAISVLTCVGK